VDRLGQLPGDFTLAASAAVVYPKDAAQIVAFVDMFPGGQGHLLQVRTSMDCRRSPPCSWDKSGLSPYNRVPLALTDWCAHGPAAPQKGRWMGI